MVNGLDKSKEQLRKGLEQTGVFSSLFVSQKCVERACLIALCILGVFGLACREGTFLTKAVVRINGEEISLGDFERRMHSQMGYSSQGLGATPEEKRKIKLALLNRLVEEKLLLQEAKRKGVALDDAAFARHLSEVKSHFSGAEFKRHLSELGLTAAAWEGLERDRLLVEELVKAEVAGKVDVTEEAVVAYYQGQRSEFRRPEQVKLRQIVVSTEAQAREVLKQIKQGKPDEFAKIAQSVSVSPDRERGGEVGYFARGEMPAVFDRAFELKPGAVSEVLESDYGFHIFLILDKKPARVQELEEVRGAIRERLRSKQEESLYAAYIDHLYRHARIQKSESLLEKI